MSLSDRAVPVYPLVLLHHQYLWVHLRLLQSVRPQLLLEPLRRHRVYPLDVIEGRFDLLLLHLALVLHKVVGLPVQELISIVYDLELLAGQVLPHGLEHIVRQLVYHLQGYRKH